jgi:acetyl esterase/lipase
MTRTLTFTDRAFVTLARGIERPTLRLLASQKLLRRIFGISAALGQHVPRGTRIIRRRDGSLWITPPGIAHDAPVLHYIHGGGFTIGSPHTHAALVAHLAQAAGMRALSLDYPLAPEHPFPAAPQACAAAYAALVADGTPPAALCGDSAGGCLALQTAIHARDTGLPLPAALGLIAPIADLSGDIGARFTNAPDEYLIPPEWPRRIRAAYLPGIDAGTAAVSPLLGDLSGLPRTLIQASTDEVLADDARRLHSALDAAELDLWDGLQHVWHLHAGRAPAANAALARMGAFLGRHAAARARPPAP